jgi:hypothetical protein
MLGFDFRLQNFPLWLAGWLAGWLRKKNQL